MGSTSRLFTAVRHGAIRLAVAAASLAVVALAAPPVAADAVRVTVVSQEPSRIVLRLELGDLWLAPSSVDGWPMHAVLLDGASPSKDEVGAPELPRVSRSVIVPDTGELSVRVLATRSHEVPAVDVVPSKGILKRTVDPASVAWSFGPPYESAAPFPAEVASLRTPFVMRDHRGVVIDLYPVQALPAVHRLRIHDELTVAIERGSGSGRNELTRARARPALAFEPVYRHRFLNYGHTARYGAPNELGSMLIVVSDPWLPNVAPLVEHKSSLGIPTTAIGVATIGASAADLEGYLQSAYDAGDLAFVLLVGDAAQVPTPTASGGASDPSYAKLAGDDDYPDVLIGRFSAESAADVDTQVARTIAYELAPATTQPWFKQAVGIGSAEGPGDDGELDFEHIDHIREALLAYDYTRVDAIYDPGAASAAVSTALDEGRGLVNYCGHGTMDSWVTTGFASADVLQLTNQDHLPVLLSVACNNGEFDHGTCFGETWLRATRNGAPTGSVGAYMSSISQSWDPPMAAQDEAVALLAAESVMSLGGLCFASSGKMLDEYGAAGVEMFDTWILFGDPSLRILGVAEPATGLAVLPQGDLEATGPVGGPFEPAVREYTLRNYSTFAIDFAVEHGAPWVAAEPASGTLAADATAVVTVSLAEQAAALAAGHFDAELRFVNVTDHDGDTLRAVSIDVGEPTLQISWPLDEDPGWTTTGQWAFGVPLGQGGSDGPPDPTAGHSGDNVYGYNLAGDYPDDMDAATLTSTPIDCSHLSQVRLGLWRWLGVETPLYDQANVRVSADGEHWTTVWRNDDNIGDASWTQLDLDISDIADGQPEVYLQWVMGPTDQAVRRCGWNIDDLELWGVEGTGCWDLDRDGYEDAVCGGDDCADLDDSAHPGADEACGDGRDTNCDGVTDADEPACAGAGGGGAGAPAGTMPPLPGAEDGCGCRLAAPGAAPRAWLAVVLGAVLALVRRRRHDSAAAAPSGGDAGAGLSGSSDTRSAPAR